MVNKITGKVLRDLILEAMNEDVSNPIHRVDVFTSSDLAKDKEVQGTSYDQAKPEILNNISSTLASMLSSNSVKDRLVKLQELLTNPFSLSNLDLDKDGKTQDDAIKLAFTNILIFDTLRFITNLNEASMGFRLENFLATILGGQAEQSDAGNTWYDVTVPGSDGTSRGISLKFMVKNSKISQTAGIENDEVYDYIIAVKDSIKPTKIEFYEMVINGKVLKKGVSVSKAIENGGPNTIDKVGYNFKFISSIDLKAASKSLKAASQSSKNDLEKAMALISVLTQSMAALKIFLVTWYQSFEKEPDLNKQTDSANGIKQSAESCVNSINLIESSFKGGFEGKTTGFNVPAEQQKILQDNKKLLQVDSLPNIIISQAYSNRDNLTDDEIKNSAIENLSQIFSIVGSDFMDTIQKRMGAIIKIFDDLQNTSGANSSIAEAISALIYYQTFYDLFVSKAVSSRSLTGSQVGASSGGFQLENVLKILTDGIGSISSYTMGGNQNKVDVAVFQDIGGGKTLIHGVSSKLRFLQKWDKATQDGRSVLKKMRDGDTSYTTYPVSAPEDFDKLVLQLANSNLSLQRFQKAGNIQKSEILTTAAENDLQSLLAFSEKVEVAADSGASKNDISTALYEHDERVRAAIDTGIIDVAKSVYVRGNPEKGLKSEYTGMTIKDLRLQVLKGFLDAVMYTAEEDKESDEKYQEMMQYVMNGDYGDTQEENDVYKYIIEKYEFRPQTFAGAVDTKGDRFNVLAGEGGVAEKLGSLDVSIQNFNKNIQALEQRLNTLGMNFFQSFRDYNMFKLTTETFLQNPDFDSLIVSKNSYDSFKSNINQVLKSQSQQQIAEVITASMLKKLIEESFKK